MDSSSVTDPSPGPSPESPLAKSAAASSFVADFRSRRPETSSGDSSPSAFFELQRPTTPAKKARNLKNLGINTTTSLTNLRGHTPAPVGVIPKEKNSSAPPSPLFIKPPTPPKRRPSNLSLTISTPGSTENKPARLVIPSTPSFNRPTLRHFQSSPSLPSMGPSGGMQLPTLRPLVTKPSGLSEVPFEMEEEDDEQNFDIPQSREEKPAAYPNGPICIYEAGVYLYFEPTAEQACTFDVIINVASEVKNPFTSPASESQKDIDARRVDGPPAESVDFAALSQRAKPITSFGMGDSSPTTPKATPPVMQTVQAGEIEINGQNYKTPEYIHMPWEHNTDIVPDLYRLVKLMDDRVQQGKRVLIHCQCGVSRSASLIVAYGLYKDPQMSVQEAYDRAKKRSKWIGPNMNLIMQLQEFRNGLLRQNDSRNFRNQGFGGRSAGLSTARSTGNKGYSAFDRDDASGSRTPQTAPLPPDSDMTMQRASTGNMMAVSPGPLSAPSGAFSNTFRRSWDASQSHFGLSAQSTPIATPYVDPAGHVVPVLSIPVNDVAKAGPEPTVTVELVEPPKRTTLQLPIVPNFSRQLPLRAQEGPSQVTSSHLEVGHSTGLQPLSFGALKSPAVSSFNLSSTFNSQQDEIMSPIKTSFDNPWPSGYDAEPQSVTVPSIERDDMAAQLASPRATEFHMAPLRSGGIDESFGMLSPRATSFAFDEPPKGPSFESTFPSFESAEVVSPVATQFPKDIFGKSDDLEQEDITSPRAEEFHMAPFKPDVAVDEDPFGLTSPTRFDFTGNPFNGPSIAVTQDSEPEDRRPSFQAILPPAHQTFNGFASLDGTAHAQPMFQEPLPLRTLNAKPTLSTPVRVDSPSTSPEKQKIPSIQTPLRDIGNIQRAPETPQTPKEAFLATPSKGIRTRFSSPNLREQRKLHKLQTTMESQLPKKAPVQQHAADDIDALMSPRAEEFTRNPFHFDLQSPVDDTSPASSNETIKDGRNGHDWTDPVPRQWTPEKATVDPRSPVQTGSSPIVRSIFDVL
ncbi:hypothetical protein BKA63DRAFT_535466 [Paraphoma chrysanthemicola]|nr:hypothetical protein BKA63DRAFT_535466 [Paraphoma chrysanthemicola]